MGYTILGWDHGTWVETFKWADSIGFEMPDYTHDDLYADYKALRNEWIKRGGPRTGPSGAVKL